MNKEENKNIDSKKVNEMGVVLSDNDLDGVAGGHGQRGTNTPEIDSFIKRALIDNNVTEVRNE
ncbi:MAG: hypothetical protein K5655_02340 [Lachnospiraceae bacterium]|nr:hypothetical protein [Lachnospiraceae bacterium]